MTAGSDGGDYLDEDDRRIVAAAGHDVRNQSKQTLRFGSFPPV
jgi:hypothetical protein